MCFIYAFDQSDSQLFVKKIWDTASYFFFFENWTRGTSHLKSYAVYKNTKATSGHYSYYFARKPQVCGHILFAYIIYPVILYSNRL